MAFGGARRRVQQRLKTGLRGQGQTPSQTPRQKFASAQMAHRRIRPLENFLDTQLMPNITQAAGQREHEARTVFETGIRKKGFSMQLLQDFDSLTLAAKRQVINTTLQERNPEHRALRLETAIKRALVQVRQ